MEEVLRTYPNIEQEALDALLPWLRHEASARDVAMLSSADEFEDAYSAFRKDHLDSGAKTVSLMMTLLGITSVAAMSEVTACLT